MIIRKCQGYASALQTLFPDVQFPKALLDECRFEEREREGGREGGKEGGGRGERERILTSISVLKC